MMLPLIKVDHVSRYFKHGKNAFHAVEDVSFEIFSGETFSLVGESGCGKSTIGFLLVGLLTPSMGNIFYNGKNLQALSKKEFQQFRKETGIIFQNPYASLDPRMTAGDIIGEPLIIYKYGNAKQRTKRVEELLELVGLNSSHIKRFPHEFSGGQRQRIGIARALAINPKFIICDEPISALDVSVQAQIINLLKILQVEIGLTYFFISHDLRVVKYLSDRVAVMYLGNIVEIAETDSLYQNPFHPYTQALLSAIPIPNPLLEKKRERIVLKGEIPSPLHPPKGCIFSSRCPFAMEKCTHEVPKLEKIQDNHFVACHLYPNKVENRQETKVAASAKG
ncbi:MAG: ATP-binding cassette domain-containing protein [Chlamydiae bacterium]|nr:ATP-binding cassette domain-containing protein [Chlamydiota bacterium]